MDRYIRMSTEGIKEALYSTEPGRSIGAEFGRVCSDFTYDKDSSVAYDHLLCAIRTAIEAAGFGISDAMARVADNRIKAHAKHGDNSIEAKEGSDTLFWIACLGEEYGEACEVVDDYPRYAEEIIDFCTVGTAWAAALARV